jgi:diacylglycerol kinase (ATP)
VSRVVVIINPVSGPKRRGKGVDRADLASRTLEKLGARGDVRLTDRAGHAHDLALDASESGADLVIGWGGDGTINEVGRALVQRHDAGLPAPALGIVPGGSGNGLARDLGIPFDPAKAIERALKAAARVVDAGELGDHVFLNVAGIGLDAHVAALVTTRIHHRGLMPYLSAATRDLLSYSPVEYTVEIDGRVAETNALVLAFANSTQWGFGARIAPGARLSDGWLDVVIVRDRGVLGNAWRIPALFTNRIHLQRGIDTHRVREITIRSREAMLFHVDGEAMQGSDTLVARVRPGVLRLRA